LTALSHFFSEAQKGSQHCIAGFNFSSLFEMASLRDQRLAYFAAGLFERRSRLRYCFLQKSDFVIINVDVAASERVDGSALAIS